MLSIKTKNHLIKMTLKNKIKLIKKLKNLKI